MRNDVDFKKLGGLVPCIVQDATTHRVLMLGFMNEEAYRKTIEEKRVTFFSRTKNRLWTKGETSGNYLDLAEMIVDCDHDTLLAKVHPRGPACHTGSDTCFDEINRGQWDLGSLEQVINERKQRRRNGSYTNALLDAGVPKVAQKVGEEAVELVIESLGDNRTLFLNEAADLMYHFMVLLSAKGCRLQDVLTVLEERHAESGKQGRH